MRSRTSLRFLLVAALTLAFLPMLSSFAPGGQVAGFTTASPAVADQIWYQSVGRASATAACEKSTVAELAAGWTQWAPSWDTWVNGGNGGFVCNRHITWAYDTPPVSCAAGAGAAGTCVLGATGPGGGKVFYVNETNATGSRYMEAALSGWNTGADPTMAWCNDSITSLGTFGTAIGTGKANTDLMVAGCTSGAAVTVRAYRGGGLSDWFLSSKDELNELYLQKDVVGGFTAFYYWSSSQNDAIFAWIETFDDGEQREDGSKDFRTVHVRPVRAF